ncbi:MAG: class I SAM-dependent rRNA methyltransferase [Candidatus Delongbacteria bacterium]|nr:class I SAM-dependent rRNA methyltransferase [Candidatus Delongbacteria bacterium]
MRSLYLKKGKEKQPLNKHSYIFSGAIEKHDPEISAGEVIKIYSSENKFIAYGHFNPNSEIRARLLEWNENSIVDQEWYRNKIISALKLRERLFSSSETDGFRLVYSEGDLLPGLIVDKFNEVLVLQSFTSGMDTVKLTITNILIEELPEIKCIYEKSDGDGRRMEGLSNCTGVLYGKLPDDIVIHENGIKYKVDLVSQKSGFYTDQRENRQKIIPYIKPGAEVLDLFSYSGGFALNCSKHLSCNVILCDSSKDAIELAGTNYRLNNLLTDDITFVTKDCFTFIRELYSDSRSFDVIILDPPKLMPKKKDEYRAVRAYKDLNFNAMKLVKTGGFLITFSCSGNFSMEEFKKMIAYSAKDAKRTVQIVEQLHQGIDHPVSVSVPESEYLKGLILRIL